MLRTRRALLLACAALMIGMTTSAVAAPASAAADDIVIGVEAPLTGSQAANGRDMLRGVRLAVTQVNAAGGIDGRRVRIVTLDDQADPSRAEAMVAKAQRAGVLAVVGPYNSSVGEVNLPLYLEAGITPVHLVSSNQVDGEGVTVQPKNNQIAPAEVRYATSLGARTIAMLVDPSAYTQGMANRFQKAMTKEGATVTSIPITEGLPDYSAQVAQALASGPDLVYVATYYPEGAKIAQSLAQTPSSARCLMDLSNVDPAFVQSAGIAASQRCVFSGEPEAAQQPGRRASAFVAQYRRAFDREPGVWGIYTYDSARLLFRAMDASGVDFARNLDYLRHVTGYPGATGSITIDPVSGNRRAIPIYIMSVDDKGTFVPQ